MSTPNTTDSRYRAMMKQLRGSLTDEKNCLYLLHTPQGAINVSSWNYMIDGFVIVAGEDENKRYRLIVFAESDILSFPLEIKRKKGETSAVGIGFIGSAAGKSDDVI